MPSCGVIIYGVSRGQWRNEAFMRPGANAFKAPLREWQP